MNNMYRLFGLNIASAVQLPATGPLHPQPNVAPDAVIEYGVTPKALTNPLIKGVRFQAAPGEFLLQVDDVARYYVQDGNRITITPETKAHNDDILPFLMGSAMGALLQQRRILVLHGSAIEAGGESVVFCGPSGIGKSTLAAGFHQRGFRFLADDLCAVVMHDGRPSVIPGFPRLKLWADTLKRLDTATDNLKSVRWGTDLKKYFLPVDQCKDLPVPIRSVFILETTNTAQFELTPLPGIEKIDPLITNSYRLRYLEGLGGKQEHFKFCAAVAAKADVCRVVRPKQGFQLEELLDLLAEHLSP